MASKHVHKPHPRCHLHCSPTSLLPWVRVSFRALALEALFPTLGVAAATRSFEIEGRGIKVGQRGGGGLLPISFSAELLQAEARFLRAVRSGRREGEALG